MKILIVIALLFSLNASASSVDGKTWFLLGVDAGFVDKSSVDSPEINNSGYALGLRGALSHYFYRWVVDGSLGYHHSKLSSKGVEVKTNSVLLDASARYRFNEHWSVGPMLTALLGKDVSFSDVGTNSDEKSVSLFLGAKAMYDWHRLGWTDLLRTGLQVQTDLDISNRQVTSIMAVVEFGWPFSKRSVRKRPEPKKVMPRVIEEKVVVAPTPKIVPPSFDFNLMAAGVRFAVNSSSLLGGSRRIIEQIAEILSRHRSDWNQISVAGHTDKTGNYNKNIRLSQMRAERVADVLKGNGVDPKKVASVGYGPDQPLDKADTKFAYARNRRVELKIFGIKGDSALAKELGGLVGK